MPFTQVTCCRFRPASARTAFPGLLRKGVCGAEYRRNRTGRGRYDERGKLAASEHPCDLLELREVVRPACPVSEPRCLTAAAGRAGHQQTCSLCPKRTFAQEPGLVAAFDQTRAEAAHSSGLKPELLTMGFQKRNSCFCNAASSEDVLGAETMPRPSSFVITWGVINAF